MQELKTWQKYEAKFAELEKKLSLMAKRHSVNAPAEAACGSRELETRLVKLEAENMHLRDEAGFLKAELEKYYCLNDRINAMRKEASEELSRKDKQISELFSKCNYHKSECERLRTVIRRRQQDSLQSATEIAQGLADPASQKRKADSGILAWLSKPLVHVGEKK